MKLIVGLGNPGEKYANNRHNVGFMFAEFLAEKLKGEKTIFKKDKYTSSETIQMDIDGDKLIVAKPQTFMNKSGIAVAKLMINNSILKKDLTIVHDDLDIPLGIMHIQSGVGPQLHNGLESIENQLKTKDFLRVRIGVDARTRENWISGESYVLNDFRSEEINRLKEEVFPRIMELLKQPH